MRSDGSENMNSPDLKFNMMPNGQSNKKPLQINEPLKKKQMKKLPDLIN